MSKVEKLTEKEKTQMGKFMKKHDDQKTILPEKNEKGVYVYDKDNVPWDIQKIFMPSMMAVTKEHLVYHDDGKAYIQFDYEENRMCVFEESRVNVLIDVENEQLSAHFRVMLFDMEKNEKHQQPFSFYLNFEDINDFGIAYFTKIKEEYKMDIKVEENTIKVTETHKKD